ncbi:unnamed protein product, partial [Chrysoparadoxa australica]
GARALKSLSTAEALGCDVTQISEMFQYSQCGFDRQGRPVMLLKLGSLPLCDILQYTTPDNIESYLVRCMEQALASLPIQSKKLGRLVERLTVVLDIGSGSLFGINEPSTLMVQTIIASALRYYPERLAHLLIVNAPAASEVVIRGFHYSQRTSSKVRLLGQGGW